IGTALGFAKKLLLAGAGCAALSGPLVCGLVIAAGHAPAIRAQVAVQTPRPVQSAPVNAAPQRTTLAGSPSQERRLLAMLLDADSLALADQARAKEAALNYVRTKLKPHDAISVMAATNGRVMV